MFNQWFDKVSKMKLDAAVLGADYYFIKEQNKTGYFAFVIPDWEFWGVEPGVDYESSDVPCLGWDDEDKIWIHSGTKISPQDLGKWRGLFCITEPLICDANQHLAQEVWVSFNGFWYDKPYNDMWLGHHYLDPASGKVISLRSEVADRTSLPEWALFRVSQEFMEYNLGLAIVPSAGKIQTFEMENLDIAVGEPQTVADSAHECTDLRKLGIGKRNNNASSSGGEVLDLGPNWFEANSLYLNVAHTNPLELSKVIDSLCKPSNIPLEDAEGPITTWASNWEGHSETSFSPSESTDNWRPDVAFAMVRSFLSSSDGQKLFTCLSGAGYGVAVIPLGGRTIWSPSSS